MGEDLLGAQSDLDGVLSRQAEGLVERVGVQRLGPAEDGGERLDRRSDHVVVGLLSGQRDPARLGVEAQHHRARVGGAKAISGDAGPEPTCGAELRDLLEEIGMAGEEEAETAAEGVKVETGRKRSIDVGDRVGQGEAHLPGRPYCLPRACGSR